MTLLWKQNQEASFRPPAPPASRSVGPPAGTQEEQDRWLAENGETINAKIRRGVDQLNRGREFPKTNSMLTWRT